jgi:NADPH-dependent curcumin reductase CurA
LTYCSEEFAVFRSNEFLEQYTSYNSLLKSPTLVLDSKIKPSEPRYLGLDKAEQAPIDLHTGDNFGKAVVVVSDDT